jgi:hypothetical protein
MSAALFPGHRSFPGIKQLVGTVAGGRLLRLAAEELVLKRVDLPLGLVKFLLQLLEALDGIGMSALPRAHFAAEITPQLLQRPLQTLNSRAVFAANRGLRSLG